MNFTPTLLLLAASFVVALVMHWRQTIPIFRSPMRWRERSAVIQALSRASRTPVRGVHLWFSLVLVVVLALAWVLPEAWASMLLAVAAMFEAGCVVQSYRGGIMA